MSWLIFIATVIILGYVIYRRVSKKIEILTAMTKVLYLHKHYVATPELMRTRIVDTPVVEKLYDRELVRQTAKGLRVDAVIVRLVSQRYNDLVVALEDPVLKQQMLMRAIELKITHIPTLTHFRLLSELRRIDDVLTKHDLTEYLR